jgi:hypothetical protein
LFRQAFYKRAALPWRFWTQGEVNEVNWKESEMDRREDYGGASPITWIIGAVLVAAAIYWLFGGFGG